MKEGRHPIAPPLRSIRNQLTRRCEELIAPDELLDDDTKWLGVLRCSVARCFAACCHRYGGGFVGDFELLAGGRHIASLRRGLVSSAVTCMDAERCKLLSAVVEAHQSTSRHVGSRVGGSAGNFAQVVLEMRNGGASARGVPGRFMLSPVLVHAVDGVLPHDVDIGFAIPSEHGVIQVSGVLRWDDTAFTGIVRAGLGESLADCEAVGMWRVIPEVGVRGVESGGVFVFAFLGIVSGSCEIHMAWEPSR
mmetsp:Transcript_15982/g.35247  ORF Transcript_15982/g.35247 Transcript_15982/m.35247 type:complete len:249 (+) Transcript_15982:2-748(+)